MKNSGSLQITTPSDREIVLTRQFNAPRQLVFDAFTKPEPLKRWFGPWSWVMRAVFLCLALSCASLAAAISTQVRNVAGYLGLALLLLSAVGMTLAGLFAPSPGNKFHELGAMLDNVPIAALLINWSLSRSWVWSSARRMLLWTSVLPLLGLAIFIISMATILPHHSGRPSPGVLVGWPNRIMILAHCAWLMPIAWYAMSANAETAEKEDDSPSTSKSLA